MADTAKFTEALIDLRFHMHMTVPKMAAQLGMSRGTLWRYEQGKCDFSLELLDQLARLAVDKGRIDLARVFLEPFAMTFRTAERAMTAGKAIA